MKQLRTIWNRIRSLWQRREVKREIDEELRFHLEQRTAENLAAGMSPEEAAREARKRFGNVQSVREECCDARGANLGEAALQDLRFALRTLRKTPGFTAITVLTFALGIGLVTVQFSFIYGALIKGLPFEGAERIQVIETTDRDGQWIPASLRHYLSLRAQQTSFEHFAGYRRTGLNLGGEGMLSRQYRGAEATTELFALTGVQPLAGRTLQAMDNLPGAPGVVVLSHSVWKADFAGNPGIVGRVLRLNGKPAVVVGVMPAGFHFPLAEQVWTNLRLHPAEAADWYDPITIIGRLRADRTLGQARSELSVLMERVVREAPVEGRVGVRATITPYAATQVGGSFATILWTLLLLVGLVLVLACVNVANLIHARALRQRHELAVRAALGASRGRLVGQMLCLSTVLAALGAVAGLLLAVWGISLLNPLLTDPKMPYWVTLDLDWRVMAGVAALTLLVGMVTGLLPALRTVRFDPNRILRDGTDSAGGRGPGRLSRILSVSQIALSSAVLVVAAVLSRGVFAAGKDHYPGDPSRLLIASCNVGESVPEVRRPQLIEELAGRVAALPGVECVAFTDRDPVKAGFPTPVEIAGRPAEQGRRASAAAVEWVSPDYFAVFGIKALRGRLPGRADRAGGELVTVINESFARRFWPGEDPVGRQVRFEGWEGRLPWHTVVGVVADVPMKGVGKEPHSPGLYLPLNLAAASSVHLLLRTSGDPTGLVPALRRILNGLAPDQPFESVMTLQQAIDQRLRLVRLISGLALAFGVAGALLAALGILGVTAFLVERRYREFGVRLALGATPAQLRWLVLRRGLGQVALGLSIGLLLGWALNVPLVRLSMLRAIARADAAIFLLVSAVVTASVLIACWWPARRAARINPAEALRHE